MRRNLRYKILFLSLALASNIVVSFQSVVSRTTSPTDPAVLTIGKFKGGTRSNIIAEKVILEGTVRTLSERIRKKSRTRNHRSPSQSLF